jgi:hypothetical protein
MACRDQPEHPGRERLITVSIVAVVSAALYGLLTALSRQERWTTAAPSEWVTFACLNAIGVGEILPVGIGRRWPFADRRDAPPEVPAL